MGLAALFPRSAVSPRLVLLGAACAILPDIDVIGFRFGVRYGDLLGHRGLTHSLPFAVALSALLAGILFPAHAEKGSWPLTFLFLFLCTASHGVFDAMTDGGLGIAFLAPFHNERYFFPWRPIAVSPIGISDFFGRRGLAILATEFLWIWVPSLSAVALSLLWRQRT